MLTSELEAAPDGAPATLEGLVAGPTPILFFTGKGGVGKTALASAFAVTLADRGRRVLIVSTDPASNLDEVFGVSLTSEPRPVTGVPGLFAMNIDPDEAAEAYRLRVLAGLPGELDEAGRSAVREQLSGACTTGRSFGGSARGRPVASRRRSCGCKTLSTRGCSW